MPRLEWRQWHDPAVRKRLKVREVSLSYNRSVPTDVFSSIHHGPNRSALRNEWLPGELFVCSPEFLILRNFGLDRVQVLAALPKSVRAVDRHLVKFRWCFPTGPVTFEVGWIRMYPARCGHVSLLEGDPERAIRSVHERYARERRPR